MNASRLRRLYELLDDMCRADGVGDEHECPNCQEPLSLDVGVDIIEADKLRAIVREEWLSAARKEVA